MPAATTDLAFDTLADALAAAKAAQDRGDVEAAAAIFRGLPGAFPAKKRAIALAAEGLRECGFWTEAVALLQDALTRMPVSRMILTRLAAAYSAVNQYQRAAEYLQRHLDYDPRDAELWLLMAHHYAAGADWGRAEAAFAHVLSVTPENFAAASGRGDVLFQLDRPADAITAYRRALLLQPRGGGILLRLGVSLLRTGSLREAEAILVRATEAEPGSATAHANLALARYNRGNLRGAVTAATKVLEIDSTSAVGYFALGSAMLGSGNFADAAAALRQAVERAPGNLHALAALAKAEAALDHIPAAERALHGILAAAPGDVEARHLLAGLHGEPLRAPLSGYARHVFDALARRFDRQAKIFGYRLPDEVVKLLEELQPDRQSFTDLLDLGCGTGLAAAAITDAFRVDTAVGIDVSPNMLAVARSKKIYHRLIEGDLTQAARALDVDFELVTAIDVFPHIGDLSDLMLIAYTRLRPGGLFLYSIECGDASYKLSRSGRFSHAIGAVEDLARSIGFVPLAAHHLKQQREYGVEIEAAIGVLQRASAAPVSRER